MTLTIYHNPRCSKSRQTLALLSERGLEPEIIEYLKTPPTLDELKTIVAALGIKAGDLVRTKEAAFKELGLSAKTMSEDEALEAMAENPVLIERPIVIKEGRAALGRPPEAVLEIL